MFLSPGGRSVSASPRKLIRRALDALEQVDDVFRRYPGAREDLERRLGPELLARVVDVRRALDEAATALDAAPPGASPTAGP